jgi:hypothetical protein
MSAVARPDLTIANFEAGNIDADQFDHLGHVYIGWLYVRQYGTVDALTRFDAGLRRLTLKLGIPGKYHATMTWFFLLLIGERFDERDGWHTFCNKNADLIADSKATLGRYYSENLLFSKNARERFVLPDNLQN